MGFFSTCMTSIDNNDAESLSFATLWPSAQSWKYQSRALGSVSFRVDLLTRTIVASLTLNFGENPG